MTKPDRARIAVLISGSGTNLQAIIDAVAAGDIAADIVGVLSDNPQAFGLERAARADIPTIAIDFRAGTKADYNARLLEELQELQPDLVVLAGYMRILPDQIVNAFSGCMLNVHPSLLPAYPGLNTYARALAAGEAEHGTTVHFVIPELDAGPAVLQYVVEVANDETEESLRERVQRGEYIIYPQVIGWFAAGRLRMTADDVYLDDEMLTAPRCIKEQN